MTAQGLAVDELTPGIGRLPGGGDQKLRLRDALTHDPTSLGVSAGMEIFRRGSLLVALPAIPADAEPWLVSIIEDARSPWLSSAGACRRCGRHLHVRRGVIRVQHASRCPGGRVGRYVNLPALPDPNQENQ